MPLTVSLSGIWPLSGEALSRHRRMRRAEAKRVAAGCAMCPRCGRMILPGQEWDLGHDDLDRSRYSGAEHRRCNRRAGGKVGAVVTHRKRRVKARRSRFG